MSRLQEHILPSVEMLIRLLAFWVPTTFTQYTGCCKENEKCYSSAVLKSSTSPLCQLSGGTVCAAADRGVLCTGVLLLLLLSHSTICPEYVPPTTTLGWNLANAADITADCQKEGKNREGDVPCLASRVMKKSVFIVRQPGHRSLEMYQHVESNSH